MTSETKAVPTLGEQIAVLRELLAKATGGEWWIEDPMGPETLTVVTGGPEPYNWKWLASICSDDEIGPDKDTRVSLDEMKVNAALIVAMKNTLPALLARIEADAKRMGEMREALHWMIELCNNANPNAFSNGNTDSTGSIDEGDVRASQIIGEARAALGAP